MVWEKAKTALKERLGESIFNLWVEPLECVYSDAEQIKLACPDRFYRAHLDRNHLTTVQETVDEFSSSSCKVTLCDKEAAILPAARKKGQLRLPYIPERRSVVRSLHPRYTFDAFMLG